VFPVLTPLRQRIALPFHGLHDGKVRWMMETSRGEWIIPTFGEQMSVRKNAPWCLCSRYHFTLRKRFSTSKITTFEEEPVCNDTHTLAIQTLLRYALSESKVRNASYVEQWDRRTLMSIWRSTLV
jgi:hypothetical protein